MGVPAIDTVLPAAGLAVGRSLIEITGSGFNVPSNEGGHVEVLFGDALATMVSVISPTRITCFAPPHALGQVDVSVVNYTPNPPDPDVAQEVTKFAAFTYVLPDLTSPPDHTNDDSTVLVTRALVAELQRCVVANTRHAMHPDYASAVDAPLEQETQATVPSLKLVGPTLSQDRFYSSQEPIHVEEADEVIGIYAAPFTVRMDFQFVGVGRTVMEAMALWKALMRWAQYTETLKVPRDGSDPANGTIDFEIDPSFESTGAFSTPMLRNAVYQFAGTISIRGVHTLSDRIGETRKVGDAGVTFDVVQME